MNNFDISSSGENIEFFCSYDTSLAQSYYDDFERENTRLNFGRDNSLFLLGDASAPYYKKSQFSTMSKKDIFELWLLYDFGNNVSINDYLAHEYISDLLAVTIEQHYQQLIANYTLHDIREHITHDYYISRGYSQGDAVYIVSIDKPIDNGLRRYINNILWDAPIYIYANINGLEFESDDFLADCFEYDKNVIYEKIYNFNISTYAKKWLCDNLPDAPSY